MESGRDAAAPHPVRRRGTAERCLRAPLPYRGGDDAAIRYPRRGTVHGRDGPLADPGGATPVRFRLLALAGLAGLALSGPSAAPAQSSHCRIAPRAACRGVSLARRNLHGVNLSHATLSHANLARATLTRANLSHANLSFANLTHTNLSHANLSFANLTHANLSHANLAGANLSHANLAGARCPDGRTGSRAGGCAARGTLARWTPSGSRPLPWQWELNHPLDLASASDMGTNSTTFTGAPALPPAVYDVDGFNTPASTVGALHAQGKRVICYIDVGTWENWRPDASQFPPALLGQGNGWPGEQWLDISPAGPFYSTLQSLLLTRFRMCASKGFDAVEPDNIDGSEYTTGFAITTAQDNQFVEWVATAVHALGMAVFQKNYVDQSASLQPYFDGVVDEQCAQFGECGSLQPYAAANKPIFEAEYQVSPGAFCGPANAASRNAAMFDLNLDGAVRVSCR